MGRKVTSDALGIVSKTLGLSGAGSAGTEMLDGFLDQTLDVGPMVRRGRTQAATRGIYFARLRNVHTDAESLVSAAIPYAVAVGANAPYPAPMPDLFDVWLIGASVSRASGGGTFNGALSTTWPAIHQGFGVDDGASALAAAASAIALLTWDAVFTEGTLVTGVEAGTGLGGFRPIGIRLLIGATTLVFRSTSSPASTYDGQLVLGVFPIGLGQDVLI